jgi:peptidoglycan/LPS O-acetylase OafA/YrhL
MRYQPCLDVYRGYCIIAVFLYHALLLDCGWVGVQAFFVVSGFLITGVLLDAPRNEDNASRYFMNFFARRVLRIFPVYFLFILVTLALAYAFTTPLAFAMREHFSENAPYLFTYTYNFYRVHAGPGSAIYMHLWSLSIEEQFYVVWPFLVFFLAESRFVMLCFCLVIAGPAIRAVEILYGTLNPQAIDDIGKLIYVSTFSHLDAFALGALLNFERSDARVKVLVEQARKWVPPTFAMLTVVMTLLGLVMLSPTPLSALGWPLYLPKFGASIWGYSALDLLFFVVIARIRNVDCGHRQQAIIRIGRVSYGFYIFHLPILWFAFRATGAPRTEVAWSTITTGLAAFAVTWVLAELSFRFVEQPFLNMRRYFPARPRLASRVLPDSGTP